MSVSTPYFTPLLLPSRKEREMCLHNIEKVFRFVQSDFEDNDQRDSKNPVKK